MAQVSDEPKRDLDLKLAIAGYLKEMVDGMVNEPVQAVKGVKKMEPLSISNLTYRFRVFPEDTQSAPRVFTVYLREHL